MKASYTIQCVHPESGQTACWIFSGDSHRLPGTSISPVFDDVIFLYHWMKNNGWQVTEGAVLKCHKK